MKEYFKKKISSVLVCITFGVILSTLLVQANEVSKEETDCNKGAAYACWAEHFDSLDKMMERADVIIWGKVISQSCEKRADLVFTRSTIQLMKVYKSIENGDTVDILQTGGELENIKTPEISDAPLLKVGDEKLFMLKKAEYDPMYTRYYLIVGGYQGIFDCGSRMDSLTAIRDELQKVWSSNKKERAGDEYYRTWGSTRDIQYSYSNVSNYAAVVRGFNSWNGIANVSFSHWDSWSSPVQLAENAYGDVDWYGLTTLYPTNTSSNILGADVRLNNSKMKNLSSFAYQAIVCHETGHVLGMMGHPDRTDTIMRLYASDYMNQYNTPQAYDRQTLQGIYY